MKFEIEKVIDDTLNNFSDKKIAGNLTEERRKKKTTTNGKEWKLFWIFSEFEKQC